MECFDLLLQIVKEVEALRKLDVSVERMREAKANLLQVQIS